MKGGFGYCFCGLSALLGLAASGCGWTTKVRQDYQPYLYPHLRAETSTQTAEEHERTVRSVVRRDAIGLMDDLDLLFMTDRPTRLSKWHDR